MKQMSQNAWCIHVPRSEHASFYSKEGDLDKQLCAFDESGCNMYRIIPNRCTLPNRSASSSGNKPIIGAFKVLQQQGTYGHQL